MTAAWVSQMCKPQYYHPPRRSANATSAFRACASPTCASPNRAAGALLGPRVPRDEGTDDGRPGYGGPRVDGKPGLPTRGPYTSDRKRRSGGGEGSRWHEEPAPPGWATRSSLHTPPASTPAESGLPAGTPYIQPSSDIVTLKLARSLNVATGDPSSERASPAPAHLFEEEVIGAGEVSLPQGAGRLRLPCSRTLDAPLPPAHSWPPPPPAPLRRSRSAASGPSWASASWRS